MKKILVVLMMCIVSIMSFGQFSYKVVNNGFDEPFKKAICYSASNSPDKGILSLEEGVTNPRLYITGLYFCDDVFLVEASFDNNHRYCLSGKKSSNSKYIHIEPYCMEFIMDNSLLCHEEWDNFWNDMKNCSIVKFRINETHCETDIYYFSLKNSTSAIKFVTIK